MSNKKKIENKSETPKFSIRIAKDPSSDDVIAVVFNGVEALLKHTITNDFIATTIEMWKGGVQTVEGGGKVYSISVQEIKPKKENLIVKP